MICGHCGRSSNEGIDRPTWLLAAASMRRQALWARLLGKPAEAAQREKLADLLEAKANHLMGI